MDDKQEESDLVRLPVLGVETAFATSCKRVRDMLRDAYGSWTALYETPGIIRPSPGVISITVREGQVPASPETSFVVRAGSRSSLEVEGGGARGSTDITALRSTLEVDEYLLGSPGRLIDEVIEPLVLFLVGAQDRVPVHAAAVIRGDVGIVLAAPSGTGKSTLAYAASRRGYSPLADDPIYVQVDPELRIWGRRSRVHLRTDTREYFPDLADEPAVRLPTGKIKLVVDPGGSRRHVERAGLCCIRRDGSTKPRLIRISAAEAVAEIATRLDPGFDLFRDVLEDRILRLAARGAWRLELGNSPLEAVSLLDEVVRAIEHDG